MPTFSLVLRHLLFYKKDIDTFSERDLNLKLARFGFQWLQASFRANPESFKDSEEQRAICLPDSANQINGKGMGTNVFVLVSPQPAKRGGGGQCPNETHSNWTEHLR